MTKLNYENAKSESAPSLNSGLKDALVIRLSAVIEAFRKTLLQKYIQTIANATAIRTGWVTI